MALGQQSSDDRALVKNASSRSQTQSAAKIEQARQEQWDKDLRAMLGTAEGRRVLWGILGHCQILASIYHPSSQIYHNAGRQDVGHFILGEILSAAWTPSPTPGNSPPMLPPAGPAPPVAGPWDVG